MDSENRIVDQEITIAAPAKLNLSLRVVGRRSDGYHLIESLMIPIDLCDQIKLQLGHSSGIKLFVTGDWPVPQGIKNLAVRAASAFFEATGLPADVWIRLAKRIPVGAGLGGGSSDAAAVLLGLNRLTGKPLTNEKLNEIGVKLGADVPFFLRGQPALAEGIGEVLKPFDFQPRPWFLLVYPGFPVSTKEVYDGLSSQLTNAATNDRVLRLVSYKEDLCVLLHNDLETVTLKSYPEVQRIKDFLESRRVYKSLMTGAGSTVFAVLPDKQQGQKLIKEVRAEDANWTTYLVQRYF